MKTKEFTRRVEELGFYVDKERRIFSIYGSDDQTDDMPLAFVDRYYPYQINTSFMELNTLSNRTKKELFKLLTDYASTPIDEREEEKKYYLKHRWLRCLGGCALLHESTKFHTFVLMGGFGEVPKDYKMKFTQKEIDEIKEKYNTDLSDFERVEVKE